MSHNYSNYGDGPSGPPSAENSNGFESLTGSLIYPDQRIPIQQNYQQTWPNYCQETNNHEMHYQQPQPSMVNDRYCPNEQEFISYDEGEDFYDNGDADTFRAVEQGGQISHQSGTISTFRRIDASNPQKPPAIALMTDEEPQPNNFRPVFATPKPDPAAINDRAAELRAKLLATKRGSTPGTPSSFKKPTGSTPKGHEGTKNSTEASKSSLNQHSSVDGQKAVDVSGRRSSPMAQKINEARGSSVMQVDGTNDIDALFAEARAANAAITAGERSSRKSTDKIRTEEKLRSVSINATTKPKPQPKVVTAKSHQPLKKTGSTSDASEVGEIREDLLKPARVPYSEHSKATGSGHDTRPSHENLTPQTADKIMSNSQVASKIDQSSGPKMRARGASLQPRDYLTTHQPPGRMSDRENYQIPHSEYRRERFEQSQLAQKSRYEQERDPKWRSGHWEKGSPAQNQQSSRPNAGESERVPADRQRRYEHDFQKSHENIEKNARIAAVYKKELEDKARQLHPPKVRVDKVESVTASDVGGVQDRPESIPKATKAVEKPIVPDQLHNANREDLADWLELTNFYDIQLRGQRLALFREMKAADAHRAELQRQAEKLGIIRSQSVQPQESNEAIALRNMTSPRNFRTSSARAMPPPPSPFQDGQDDVGIKIKNSASRENLSSPRRLKRVHAEDDLEAGHSQSKLQRLDPDGRSGQSRPRLSSPTFGREQTSFEERTSVEDRKSLTVVRPRSRSPRARRRSLTPIARRRERQISPTRFNAGDIKSEQQPRESISNFRDYESKTREERDNRFLDYNPRWNSYRPNAQHYQDSPNNNYRGRGRGGRGGYHTDSRAGYKPQRYAEGASSGEDFGSASLDLRAGGSRYFMIKSWNSDNVETAQRDCIWATQPKNIATLTEAYNSCRNVILFFSINLSKAFQGYARMTSAPSEDNPAPAWSKPLIWEASPPFHIQWIVISETPFHRTGHLKNEYNDGHAVLVGKDGQEIEPKCGAALCEVIDEEAKAQAREDQDSEVGEYQGRVWHSGHEVHGGWRGYDTYRGRRGRGRGSSRRHGSDGYEDHTGGYGRFEGDGAGGGKSAGDSWVNADNSGPWMNKVEGDDKMDWS